MTRAEEKSIAYQLATHGPNVMGGASVLSEDEYMRLNMNYDFKAGYEAAEKDILDDAKQVVASFEQAFKQAEKDFGWHPATEYPPEDEEVIVLTVPHGIKNFYEIQVSHMLKGTKLWAIRDKVVWWMPMPKLPNEDE